MLNDVGFIISFAYFTGFLGYEVKNISN